MSAITARLTPIEGASQNAEPRPQRKKPRRALINLVRAAVIVGGIGLAVVIPLGWGSWIAGFTNQTTDNAYLRADTTPISAQVDGRVRRLLVGDYQHVKAGDVLVEIDDAEYLARVAQALAGVAAAEATLRNLDSRLELQRRVIAQSEAGVAAVIADQDRAVSERSRQEALARDGWSSRQRLELAVADTKRFDAQLAEKQAEVAAARQQLDVLHTQAGQADAELGNAHAALDLAQIELSYTRIKAPVDGVVSASGVREGQYVRVGSHVISVVPLPNVYVLANYKETQLGKVRPGQTATVTVDALPGRVLNGRVARLSPASGSEFSLLPPDNATGNFTKVAQRIGVRIELDPAPALEDLLRPGMSVVATIRTDQPSPAMAER